MNGGCPSRRRKPASTGRAAYDPSDGVWAVTVAVVLAGVALRVTSQEVKLERAEPEKVVPAKEGASRSDPAGQPAATRR